LEINRPNHFSPQRHRGLAEKTQRKKGVVYVAHATPGNNEKGVEQVTNLLYAFSKERKR
jgi:hypothetical protein